MMMNALKRDASMAMTVNDPACAVDGGAKRHCAERDAAGTTQSLLQSTYTRALCSLPAVIQRNILDAVDPTMELATERLREIYSRIFREAPAAFEYGLACLALAKRGGDLNHLTLYINPCGEGLSPYTAHLERMLPYGTHTTFDPVIFSDKYLLWSTVPSMAISRACTGFNRPTDTMPPFDADVLLKMCNGKLPCWHGSFRIKGWKRLEASGPVTINCTTEDEFDSILRIVAVVPIQSLAHSGSATPDPGVGAFLVSRAAVAVGYKIQAEFEAQHKRAGWKSIVDQYISGESGKVPSAQFVRMCIGPGPVYQEYNAENFAVEIPVTGDRLPRL